MRMVLDNHISDYPILLAKSAVDPLKTKRIKTLATEIYITLNSINPNYIKEIFKMNESQNYNFRSHNALTLFIPGFLGWCSTGGGGGGLFATYTL